MWRIVEEWNCPRYMLKKESGRELIVRQSRRAIGLKETLEQEQRNKIAQKYWKIIRDLENASTFLRMEGGKKEVDMREGEDIVEQWGSRDREGKKVYNSRRY